MCQALADRVTEFHILLSVFNTYPLLNLCKSPSGKAIISPYLSEEETEAQRSSLTKVTVLANGQAWISIRVSRNPKDRF